MPNLVRIVYVSEAVVPFGPAELAALIRTSQRNNSARGLTGLLLHAGGQFIQALEGPADAVSERLDVITADPRHRRVHRFLCEVGTDRLFGKWAMGLLNGDAAASLDRARLRGVIDRAAEPTGVDRTQVHKLLTDFRDQLAAAA